MTSYDLTYWRSQRNLLNTMNGLLSMKIVPLLNGNDVVAPTPQMDMDLENVSVVADHSTVYNKHASVSGEYTFVLTA